MKKRMTGAVMSLLILASSLAVSDSSTMGSALENEAAEHSESMFLEEDEDQNRKMLRQIPAIQMWRKSFRKGQDQKVFWMKRFFLMMRKQMWRKSLNLLCFLRRTRKY